MAKWSSYAGLILSFYFSPLLEPLPLPSRQLSAADLQTISTFLARRDFLNEAALISARADVIVVCGSECLHPLFTAVSLLAAGVAERLILAGGIGHGTARLYAAVNADARLAGVRAEPPLSEGAVLRDAAIALGADPTRVFAEERSTNCGANAVESRRLLEGLLGGSVPRSVIVLQDPTMQRRTHETFVAAWAGVPGGGGADIRSWASFVPVVAARGAEEGGGLTIAPPPSPPGDAGCAPLPPQWDVSRFVGLCLGEVPRLRDDEQGYGPRGKGFIGHVDVPAAVEEAFARLTARHVPRVLAS